MPQSSADFTRRVTVKDAKIYRLKACAFDSLTAIHLGHLVRFQNGNSKFYSRPCYGYTQSLDGTLEIVPEEAAAVTLIYEWRAEGLSLRTIAGRLMEMNIKAPRGGKVWGIETIRKILNNEKYYGDVLLQKTYIADFFTGKQVPNRGECEYYLLKDHHEAIIYDKDIFTLITD